ncbi:hypothetical protein HK104_001905 [Borealophlyctis nickersoniae]|nr:hypothetical protein HK104_001905 [Borealophlyctis nickersoniae]
MSTPVPPPIPPLDAKEIAIHTIEAISLTIIVSNVIYSYYQLVRRGRTSTNWGNAIAQTVCLAWCIVSWIALDVRRVVIQDVTTKLHIYQSIGLINLTGFGLQLAMMLKWLPATQQCLRYNRIYNKLIVGLSGLLFAACVALVIVGMTKLKASAGLEPYSRIGMTLWGGYSCLLSIGIAGTVAAMVLRVKRNVLRAQSRHEKSDHEDTAQWLDRVNRVLYAGNGMVSIVVVVACVVFGTAQAGDRLAASVVKIAGAITLSWLLFNIHTIRTVSTISQQYRNSSSSGISNTPNYHHQSSPHHHSSSGAGSFHHPAYPANTYPNTGFLKIQSKGGSGGSESFVMKPSSNGSYTKSMDSRTGMV